MKESDRLLQWCPHRRTTISFDPPGPPGQIVTVAGNALTAGALTTQVEIGTCIGHGCSQWRWDGNDVQRVVEIPRADARVWVRGSDGLLHRPEPAVRPPGVDATFSWNGLLDQWERLWPSGDRPGHCGLSGAAGFD
jgi:hypothetical protein